MNFPRRQFLHLAAGALASPVAVRLAFADVYPSRPVRLIVGFTPAGGNDIIARLMGHWLTERLGQHSSSRTALVRAPTSPPSM
jgi:tripartite-type tricarboxylate transporter receptor subunit TctC